MGCCSAPLRDFGLWSQTTWSWGAFDGRGARLTAWANSFSTDLNPLAPCKCCGCDDIGGAFALSELWPLTKVEGTGAGWTLHAPWWGKLSPHRHGLFGHVSSVLWAAKRLSAKGGGDRNTASPRAQCPAPHAPSTPAPPCCSANPLLTPSCALCRLGLVLRYSPDNSWWQPFARGHSLNEGWQCKSNPLLMRNPPRSALLRAAEGAFCVQLTLLFSASLG